MRKYLHAENMVIALYCISYYKRTQKETPTREQLFAFSDWDSLIPNPQYFVDIIKLNLEIETTRERIKYILSPESRRCILYAWFDFIDSNVDAWLIDSFPHLRDFSGGKFKCTLTKYVDRRDAHNLDLFDHLDHANKIILMEAIKGRWVQ